MTDIVITEFLEPAAIEVLKKDFKVHWDRELWTKRADLEKLVRNLPGADRAQPHARRRGAAGAGAQAQGGGPAGRRPRQHRRGRVRAARHRGVLGARRQRHLGVRVCHRHGHDPAARAGLSRHAAPGGRRMAARGAGSRRRAGGQAARHRRARLDRLHHGAQGARAGDAGGRVRSLSARRQRALEHGREGDARGAAGDVPMSSPSTAP